MAESFSIARSRCSVLSDPALREEIMAHTGSEAETSSILRSLERFGTDASAHAFEITPVVGRRTHHDPRALAWVVRAVR